MTDYSKMSTDDLRSRVGQKAFDLPTAEKELEISKAENTLMLAELRKREEERNKNY